MSDSSAARFTAFGIQKLPSSSIGKSASVSYQAFATGPAGFAGAAGAAAGAAESAPGVAASLSAGATGGTGEFPDGSGAAAEPVIAEPCAEPAAAEPAGACADAAELHATATVSAIA